MTGNTIRHSTFQAKALRLEVIRVGRENRQFCTNQQQKKTVATVKLLNLGWFLHSIQIHSYEEHGIILFIFYWVILETSTPRHFHTENLELHYPPLDALMHFRIYQISHLSPLDSRHFPCRRGVDNFWNTHSDYWAWHFYNIMTSRAMWPGMAFHRCFAFWALSRFPFWWW
jgi:hypothetical protein